MGHSRSKLSRLIKVTRSYLHEYSSWFLLYWVLYCWLVASQEHIAILARHYPPCFLVALGCAVGAGIELAIAAVAVAVTAPL